MSQSMPACFAVFSLTPVVAMVISNTLMTELPWEPGYRLSPPQMLSAAMRPCLLAGPARERRVSCPVTKCFTCTASPTA